MPDRLKSTGKRNPLPYGRSHYRPGEEFMASSVDARILVLDGLATRVEEEVPALLQQPPTAASPVEPPMHVIDAFAPIEQKRKRGRPRKNECRRRDLRAEE